MAASNENNTTDKGLGSNVCDVVTFYGSSLVDRNDPFNTEGNGTAKFIGLPGSKMKATSSSNITAASTVATTKRNFRTDLTRNELLTMLCYLEGELQARDVVIATLRNERVKHLLHTLRNKPPIITADDPYAALFRDRISSNGNLVSRQSSTQATQAELECRAVIEAQMDTLYQMVSKQRTTQLRMVKTIKESLDTNQRMRQELEDEKRKHEHDTAQGDDITYGLEMERTKLKQELESEKTQRKKLEKDIKKLQEQLDYERSRQKQIVLLLLAERKKIIMKYIEERKRSEDLAQILSEEKQRSDSIAEGLEEESKKSLRMEAELEKQTLSIENERKAMKTNLAKDEKRIKELEMEIAQLRSENEAFRKQVAATVPLRVPAGHNVPVATLPAKVRNIGDESSGLGPTLINVAKIVQPTATVSSVPVSGPTTGIARSISPSVGFATQPAKVTPRKLSNQTSIATSSGSSCGNNIIQSSIHLSSSTLSTSSTSSFPSSSSTLSSLSQPLLSSQSLSSSPSPSSSSLLSSQSSFTAPIGSVDVVQSTINAPSLNLTNSTVTLSTVPIAVGGLPTIGKVPSQAVQLPNSTSQPPQQQQQQQYHQIGTILRSSSSTSVTTGGSTAGGNSGSSLQQQQQHHQQQQQSLLPVAITGSGISGNSVVGRGAPPPIPPNKPIVPPKREPSISRLGSITANNISNSSS